MAMSIELITRSHQEPFLNWLEADEECRVFISNSAPPATTISELFNKILEMRAQSAFYAWVYLNDDDAVIGYAELKETDKVAEGEFELIYAIAGTQRNKGHASKLVAFITSENSVPDCDKIIAYVNPSNFASQRALLKNEFQQLEKSIDQIKYVRSTQM